MLIEVKGQNIIITDARDGLKLRRYIRDEKGGIERSAKSLWKRQRELVTIDNVKRALQMGDVPSEWADPWNEMIREFVRDDLIPEWLKGIETAADGIARKVNRIQRKQFDFDPTSWAVKNWVDTNGGTLIVNLTAAQLSSAHALLQDQIALGVTSPYVLAQRVRPIVGLTEKKALYLIKAMNSLIEEGLPLKIVNLHIERLANALHKNRAITIARTEISNAYNFGQMDSLRQARDAGWLPGEPEKTWIAGGADPCEICEANEAEGSVALSATFSSGDEHPTAHPKCECSVGYKVRR